MSKTLKYLCASAAAVVLGTLALDYSMNTRRTFEGNHFRASKELFGFWVNTQVEFADETRTNFPYKMCPYEMKLFLLENAEKARLPIDPRNNKPYIRLDDE